MKMKILVVCVAAMACSFGTMRADIELDFSSLSGGGVYFDGASHFSFIPAPTTSQFKITDAGLPENGDQGYITSPSPNGFTIGAVTDFGGGTEFAPISGTGMFTIIDKTGHAFAGSVSWVDMITSDTFAGLNLDAVLNLNSISYNGTEADLLAIKNIGGATDTITFTIDAATQNLTSLVSSPSTVGQFAGEIYAVAVPEPTTLLAGALLALPFGLTTLRVIRRKKT
jgi:hypothetical protein